MRQIKLGLNIDHVATLRNARQGTHPDLLLFTRLAIISGSDIITAHIREDRRHINEHDVKQIKNTFTDTPLNLEIATTEEMIEIALDIKPNEVCFVPEKREELTTEGGYDIVTHRQNFTNCFNRIRNNNIKVSVFLEPDIKQINTAAEIGVDIIELHTGKLANASTPEERILRLSEIKNAADAVHKLGIQCNAGHGLTYDTINLITQIPHIHTLHIGHFIIGESLMYGIQHVISKIKHMIDFIE